MAARFEIIEQRKNDFQNAKKRNLHTWTQWRTRLNDRLVEAVLDGVELTDFEPIAQCMHREVPYPDHPTANPKTLMAYSAAENTSTNLRRKNFYKYGIPRARIDPSKQESMIKTKLRNQYQCVALPSFAMRPLQSDENEEPLALDYFNYCETNKQRSSAAA